MQPLDFFHRANADYLERLHAQYRRDPHSVGREWQAFFAGFQAGSESSPTTRRPIGDERQPADDRLAEGAYDLVHSYRELGHCIAKLDPLGHDRPPHPLLELGEFGLSEADLDRPIGRPGNFLGPPAGTLRELRAQLTTTYCGTLGIEYMEITDPAQRTWLQERMEPTLNQPSFSDEEQLHILQRLMTAESFEAFLHAKFVGQKRFSIEGAESLIPLLETLIDEGAALGAEEVVMGMPHRGRLNVLAHVVNKPYEIIFSEFAGTTTPQSNEGEGDVKYHLGYSYNRVTSQGHKVHCSLSSNPSHLELIDPVIEGIVRAKQERRGDEERGRVVPILIHGEAAFTGQGIVPETLGLSELPAYRTGGTIHVIVNNQVGFTATPSQTRFTPYPTDVAKMIQAPIFHVNGDDPAAVVHAANLAIAFRQQFKVDVLIDLWCYRRHGHNEADDPTFTQPLMYRQIAKHPTLTKIYSERLLGQGRIDQADLDQFLAQLRQQLDQSLELARELRPRQRIFALGGNWQGLGRAGTDWSAKTAVDPQVLRQVTDAYLRLPDGFAAHRKLKRLFESRAAMAAGTKPADWGCAEMWAIGSLLLEKTAVRLTGQDVERGTFSHRHAVLHDTERGERYVPLAHLAEDQGRFTIVNTMLSELAVLGFEYGYSSADPHTLVVWEAQFGDFVNGAQPVIDLFIASAEAKWQRMSGIVLLLPHGYEGQGPEHSSARPERFLQLCAANNMQVCCPTHPAQYFHALRQQMHRGFRKPLVLLTPKSLLRDERSASPLADFTQGAFHPVLDDPSAPDRDRVQRLVLCSGRVFYTLQAARDERQAGEIALVRIEQLYPFPREELQKIVARYRRAHEVAWVQEEPRNMGAWSFIEPRLRELLPDTSVLTYHGRVEAASPATGAFGLHEVEEQALIAQALARVERVPPSAESPARVENGKQMQGDGSTVKQATVKHATRGTA
ncbi:MAG: 2-oxoglutarate dehydrogenase E1 component [Pirellulaceae bacterium]